jgi:hypothetical protein
VRQSLSNQLATFEKLEPGLFTMWGSAAWAQIQLTPGVSTLAAPRSIVRRRLGSAARQRSRATL